MRIAFLHLAPFAADPARNRRLIEDAVAVAAGEGAGWILTPELCVTGYTFSDTIGTEWIEPARARPVCFCFQGFLPPPETSVRVLTLESYWR